MNRPTLVFTVAIALLATVVALAGCAQVADLRKALVEDSFTVGTKTADVWKNTADHGGE